MIALGGRSRNATDTGEPSRSLIVDAILAWFPAGALGLYFKHTVLTKQYLTISRSIGRDSGDDILLLEKLSLFRLDILVCFVAVSHLLAVLVRPLAPKMQRAVVIAISIAFSMLIFTNLQSLGTLAGLCPSICWPIP